MARLGLVLIWLAGPAQAHDPGAQAPSAAWTFDPWIVLPLAAALLVYGVGYLRLRRRTGRSTVTRSWQTASFVVGWLSLAGALVSPLHALGEQRFTFHMIEHEVVIVIAAPLWVLSRPLGVWLWGLPSRWRLALAHAFKHPTAQWSWNAVMRHATVLHGLAIWLWHVPPLFDAAVSNVVLHRLQHLSFFATALLFWWAIIRPPRLGTAVGSLFATMFHTGFLGALIVLTPRVLYTVQTAHAPAWGLTPLEDQQLAGLIMWVPPQLPYAIAALTAAVYWIRGSTHLAGSPGRAADQTSEVNVGPVRPSR